jgi:hypothetical protein
MKEVIKIDEIHVYDTQMWGFVGEINDFCKIIEF